MNATLFSIVLAAALLHAVWNALVKGARDKAAMLGLIALGHVGPGIILVAISDPMGWAALPYIIASTVIHWGYYVGLNAAYRTGDLSVVYPIARGLSPVLIALGAWVWVGEVLQSVTWVGVALVSVGILVIALGALRGPLPLPALLAALGVAVTISAYSLVDGVGVRASSSATAYIGWLFVFEIFVALFVIFTKWERVSALPAQTIRTGLLGGTVSGVAYGLVIYAQASAPLGIVSALRETSVIFAALIGLWWFSERPAVPRLMAAVVVAIGIVLIAR